MIDTSKGFYLDLENKLHTLRVHFSMCKDLKNEDVLEWARFFQGWSQEAASRCGDWSRENLKNAEAFVKNLEKTKVGIMGYEVLERVMGEAAMNLNGEILKAVRNDGGIKQTIQA